MQISLLILPSIFRLFAKARCARKDRGIAIGPILFVVALLAVLAAAIAAGSGAFSSNTSTERARAMAQALISQGQEMKLATELVMGNGCNDTQVSFQHTGPTGSSFNNLTSPADGRCRVFHPNGGRISYPFPPLGALDSAQGGGNFGNYVFSGGNGVRDVGSGPLNVASAMELGVHVQNVRADVCLEINRLTGRSAIIDNGGSFAPASSFDGNFSPSGQLSAAEFSGRLTNCFYSTTASQNTYVFHQVLWPR